MSWGLNGNRKFDACSFYNKLWKTPNCIFPWKGIWKAKVPKRVAFFLWMAAHDRILTLDNLGVTLLRIGVACAAAVGNLWIISLFIVL